MAGAALRLDVSELQEQLRALAVDLQALAAAETEQLLRDVGESLESQTVERFESKRGPDGEPWQPWSARYAAERPDRGALLVLDGDLRQSITHQLTGGDSLAVGSRDVRAATHQYGDTRLAWGRVQATWPARPYLDTRWEDPESTEELAVTVEQFMRRHAPEEAAA